MEWQAGDAVRHRGLQREAEPAEPADRLAVARIDVVAQHAVGAQPARHHGAVAPREGDGVALDQIGAEQPGAALAAQQRQRTDAYMKSTNNERAFNLRGLSKIDNAP